MSKKETYKYFIFIPITCVAVFILIFGYTVLNRCGFLQQPVATQTENIETIEIADVKITALPEKIRKG